MSSSERKESLPPTPESHPQDDFSDASAASDRRKYQRGGRKKNTSAREPRKSRMPPVPQPQEDDEEDQYEQAERELIQDEPDEAIGESVEDPAEDPGEDYYEEEGEEEESSTRPTHRENVARSPEALDFCTNCSAPRQPRPTATESNPTKTESPFETGIKAFNLKKASGSGGRPIGVRAQSTSEKKSKKSKKPKKSEKKGKKPMDESDSDGDSDESEEELNQRPMSIRLDLNLMVEIFLKARIKGDVTITFL
ncbi:hypothetical protein BDZ45DRAFT_679510 [Acephala macrosclerotiorum]|nr:hypothetical protein BDZ45DRAFT_679510 [Acephala macrosclerotiorum]